MRWRRGWTTTGVVLGVVVGLTACSAGPPSPALTSPGSLPPDVVDRIGVEIYQARLDWAERVVSLRVHNDSDEPVTIVSGRLVAPGFVGVAAGDRERRAPAGYSQDVEVPLGKPECTGGAAPAPRTTAAPDGTRVELALADDAGRTASVTLVPDDPTGNLARIHDEDCAAALVATGATITAEPELATRTIDDELRAVVRLRVTPVAGGPRVEVLSVDRTILFAPPGQGRSWPASVSDGVVELPTVATRCDPHAVAEDKRGTFWGVHATVDGVEQHVFYVPSPPELGLALYAFVGDACGWPDR